MYLLLDDANTILLITQTCKKTSIGWQVNKNMIIRRPDATLIEVDKVPDYVEPIKYRYMDGVFSISPHWVEPVNEVAELKKQVETLTTELKQVNTDVNGIDPNKMNTEEYRSYLRNKNNQLLAKFLLENPLKWTNGKYYGATEEDQSLMLNNYNGWKMFTQLGIPIKLEWNAANEGCTEWTEEEYLSLMGAIYTYAKKMLKLCQWYKVKIINAANKFEMDAVSLEYSIEKADEVIQSLQATG